MAKKSAESSREPDSKIKKKNVNLKAEIITGTVNREDIFLKINTYFKPFVDQLDPLLLLPISSLSIYKPWSAPASMMLSEENMLMLALLLFGTKDVTSINAHCLPALSKQYIRIRIAAGKNRKTSAIKEYFLTPFKPLTLLEKHILLWVLKFKLGNQNFWTGRLSMRLSQVI